MTAQKASLMLLVLLLLPGYVYAIGRDYDPEMQVGNNAWPATLLEVANSKNRVHGFLVDFVHEIFFRGDTESLNSFLEKYASIPDVELKVVIHAGKIDVKSPWDPKPRNEHADWRLYVSGIMPQQARFRSADVPKLVTRVDVSLCGDIDLSKLSVPKNIDVQSGGEIDAFVEAHHLKRQSK